MEVIASQAHRIRWAFNFEEWRPTPVEWQRALSFLQQEEIDRIGRPIGGGAYLTGYQNPDAKSSLIGRLLMRKVVHDTLGLPFKSIKLARTKKGKPYLDVAAESPFANFNFNVSHAGGYVVCGAEDAHLIGVDVMKVELRGRSQFTDEDQRVEEFFNDMKNCFTASEWKAIRNPASSKDRLEQFYIHWTLKEGYIKAVGIGLGFELQRAEFTLDEKQENATVKIDVKLQERWHFEIHRLDSDHVASVAYGPPEEADESCQYINRKATALASPKGLRRVSFKVLSFEDIVNGMEALS